MDIRPWWDKDLPDSSVRIVMNYDMKDRLKNIAQVEQVSLSKVCRFLLAQAIEAEESK